MSTLKADTIQSTGGGAATLTKQQAAKIFCNFNQTGTQAIRASFNVSSIADDGTGQTDISFTSNMGSADYNFVCGKGRTGGQNGGAVAHDNDTAPTASLFRIIVYNESNAAHDDARANVTIFGDLA